MPVPNPGCVPGRDYLVDDRSMKANDIDQSNPGVMHEQEGGKGAEKVSGTVVLKGGKGVRNRCFEFLVFPKGVG